jgi:hypothetical protein
MLADLHKTAGLLEVACDLRDCSLVALGGGVLIDEFLSLLSPYMRLSKLLINAVVIDQRTRLR